MEDLRQGRIVGIPDENGTKSFMEHSKVHLSEDKGRPDEIRTERLIMDAPLRRLGERQKRAESRQTCIVVRRSWSTCKEG